MEKGSKEPSHWSRFDISNLGQHPYLSAAYVSILVIFCLGMLFWRDLVNLMNQGIKDWEDARWSRAVYRRYRRSTHNVLRTTFIGQTFG